MLGTSFNLGITSITDRGGGQNSPSFCLWSSSRGEIKASWDYLWRKQQWKRKIGYKIRGSTKREASWLTAPLKFYFAYTGPWISVFYHFLSLLNIPAISGLLKPMLSLSNKHLNRGGMNMSFRQWSFPIWGWKLIDFLSMSGLFYSWPLASASIKVQD